MFLLSVLKVLLGLHVVLVPVYCYLIWNFNYWAKRGLRTARPITIFGTFPSIITRKRNIVYDIHDTYLRYKAKNLAIGVFITRRPEILILDPKLAHEILVTKFRHYHDPITSSWVNDRKKDKYAIRNPFWCAGEEWKMRRMEILAGLTANKLKQSFPIWQNSGRQLIEFLQEKTEKHTVAVVETKNLINRYTADVMCDYIWGIDAGAFTQADGKPNLIIEMTEKWLEHTYKTRNYSLVASIAPIVRKIWPFTLFHEETDQFFSQLTLDAISLRRKDGDLDRPDFLNFLLQAQERKNISHDDIVGYALTILLDGYETTGIALMHTLFYLAKYPLVQEKLRAEILAVTANGSRKGKLTFEELMGLSFMDQCIYETMRLITLLPYISRICTEPTMLQTKTNKYIEVPKGIVVTLPVYSFHHDEDFYPEHNTYNPERFNDGAHVELTKRGVYLPFSDGPRICLGVRMTLMTVKLALVEILSQFEVLDCLQTPPEQNPNVKSFVLSLEGDIMLAYKRL